MKDLGIFTWKKTVIVIGIFLFILGVPLLLVSNPMMDIYQDRIDKNPHTSFHRWLQLNAAAICLKTMRPERAADMYRKFIRHYPNDPEVAFAQLRYALALENSKRYRAAEEEFRLWLDTYEETGKHAGLVDEARKGFLRCRYR